jgi:hypothetical protein
MTKQGFFTLVALLCAATLLGVAGLLYAQACEPCIGGTVPTRFNIQGGDDVVRVEVEFTGLRPSSPYVLCFNGKSNHPASNELLLRRCRESSGNLAYCNIATTYSDAEGRLRYQGSYRLLEGDYEIKFLLKDKDKDFCPIFCNNTVSFTVR